MAKVSQVLVPDQQSLDSAVTSYIAQGFTVQNRTQDAVVLFKKNEFSVLWAVLGFLICLVPLLVYLIVYATQSDQMVEIRVVDARGAPAHLSAAPSAKWSDDGHYWWDGRQWVSAAQSLPPDVHRSDDGAYYWNGHAWVAVPDATTSLWASRASGAAPGPEAPVSPAATAGATAGRGPLVIEFEPEEQPPPAASRDGTEQRTPADTSPTDPGPGTGPS